MTIRRILLFAFLLVGLLPSAVLMILAFSRTHDAMQREIEQAVQHTASSVSNDFDQMLSERLLNATTWNHLEVMQDLRIGDVDKRLSAFLSEMKRRYGSIYLDLCAVDPTGRVVASSNPADIGSLRPAGVIWQTARLPGGDVRVPTPSPSHAGRRLELRAAIDSTFSPESPGELVVDLDWASLEALLDQAADASRQVLMLDHDGRVVAASSALRARGLDFGSDPGNWKRGIGGDAIQIRPGAPLLDGDVILGYQSSRDAAGFAGFGWTMVLAQSRAVALAPVQHMAWAFAGLFGATLLATIAVTFWVAGVIARPVVALTRFTRDYLKPGTPARPPAQGPGEIGELHRSFVRLVDDLQRSQQSLVQASRLAALGEVTALVAHEVRTPLGILRSSVQMLGQERGLSAEGAELLRIVESETARLNRLVGSLLNSTRTRAPVRTPIDVHALIEHGRTLLAAYARERGIAVAVVRDAPRAVADCDAEQITQVLLNLVMNALQILPSGGRVEIRTRNESRRLVIEVGDDGPGIAPEERGRLFEPFVFKREGGTGLGLAVVRQIARSHGGDVTVETSALGGALFRVWLPLDKPDTV